MQTRRQTMEVSSTHERSERNTLRPRLRERSRRAGLLAQRSEARQDEPNQPALSRLPRLLRPRADCRADADMAGGMSAAAIVLLAVVVIAIGFVQRLQGFEQARITDK